MAIDYYYKSDELDLDNIIKPILDELIGLVYRDDKQIVELMCRKCVLPASSRIDDNTSVELRQRLLSTQPFLRVIVEWGDHLDKQPNEKYPDRVHETASLYRADSAQRTDAVSVGKEEIERMLSDLETNASTRLVRSFAALEAALRLAFDKVGLKPSSNETYPLIALGTSSAFLEQSEYWELSRLMEVRDAVVHGYTYEAPTEGDLLLLAEVTHRVVVESETAKLEYDY